MLVDFRIENFRSFKEEQTLNLVALNRESEHPDHCSKLPQNDQKILPIAVIYGANASGKSNLVKAMAFAKGLIVPENTKPNRKVRFDPFRFQVNTETPSGFEFRFVADNQIFTYGFTASTKIHEEWLSVLNEAGREIEIYHRNKESISIGDKAKLSKLDPSLRELLELLQLLGTRSNQLLMSKIYELSPERRGELLNQVIWWFNDRLTIIEPESSFSPLIDLTDQDPDYQKFSSQFLSSVGTGISGFDVGKNKEDSAEFPSQFLDILKAMDGDPVHINGMIYSLDSDDPNQIVCRKLDTTHSVGETEYSLPLDQESDGTQRLLHLLPALYYLQKQKRVFIIDELDRSLHPLLTHAFLKFFLEKCPGTCQQLILTTHEAHLLDLNLLRRDEIWFTEKDASQQTSLYSLTDMKVRKDLRIEKGYLHGRFGGIPVINSMDRLGKLGKEPGEL